MIKVRKKVALLARREEGTMMTEFVIALPIFLFFFTAIMALGNLTQGAIQIHADAAPTLWVSVYDAEDNEDALDPEKADVFGREVSPDGLEAELDNISTSSGGQWEELEVTVQGGGPGGAHGMGYITGKMGPSLTVPTDLETEITQNPQEVIGESMAAAAVAHDQSGNTPTGTDDSIFGEGLNDLLNSTELSVNAGWAGATRYGAVASQTDETVDSGYNTFWMGADGSGGTEARFQVEYTARISPSPDNVLITNDGFSGDDADWLEDPETAAWVATRMWVNEQPNYSDLFDIGTGTTPDLRIGAGSDDDDAYIKVDPHPFDED